MKGARRFESTPLRQTVCNVYIQSGDGGKSARDAGLSRSMRPGESYLSANLPNRARFSPRAEKPGRFRVRRLSGSAFAQGASPLQIRRTKALVDPERIYLRRPFERHVDPV